MLSINFYTVVCIMINCGMVVEDLPGEYLFTSKLQTSYFKQTPPSPPNSVFKTCVSKVESLKNEKQNI
jgi:hypothetical protein